MRLITKFIPNLITITRIIMSFLFAYAIIDQFLYNEDKSNMLIILFSAICISDLLDGRIARKMNSVSIIGAKLDVFADLLYIILSYVTLVNVKILPLWFLGFVCLKFSEFIATSKFMKNYNKNSNNPFVFDKIGRAIAAMFFIIPGIACIYKCFETNSLTIVLNCLLYVIFFGGIYSSYLRIKSCLVCFKLNNNIDI
ncbi:CDP-alcohol phosphatidyltransferase family protein [Clostridium chromiireducens]|uniref:CDP-diacylglycerol--glycerol-3-phosphate 3-phosphatidyltransferase n=1 Tax=Clostridium chromiireducens TaxID=225345 RepID=A0A1V4IKX5_9CLOT|nr:CDP-alcohol phosphatidyltransferase family protein [Clostridium chromiireducens]OPJ60553.1 CDP-diacylglycerol--glycerol-3-phosphate 3-phosphatidyltransferase [Clostridium chromiireducens]